MSISVIKILLNAARPKTYKLGNFENTTMYQDVEQYPSSSTFSGILVLRICAPLFFANAGYLRERYYIHFFEKDITIHTYIGVIRL